MKMYRVTMNNVLCHHGIKGQEWGVRNGPPYPLDSGDHSAKEKKSMHRNERSDSVSKGLTDEQKKKILKAGLVATGVGLGAIGAVYLVKSGKLKPDLLMSPELIGSFGEYIDINKVSDTPLIISKSTVLQRISREPLENYTNEGERIYASYLKNDNLNYKRVMPNTFRMANIISGEGSVLNPKAYTHKLELSKDLKIASEKDVVETYKKVFNVDSVDKGYFRMVMADLGASSPNTQKFFDTLRKNGFDGMIDYHDAGVITSAPLIIFDPKSVISNATSEKLSKLDTFVSVLKS